MCRDDRPVTPTDVGDGDQPGCACWERRLLSAKDEVPENVLFRRMSMQSLRDGAGIAIFPPHNRVFDRTLSSVGRAADS